MYLLAITEFIAHLHPALVHLPIGILLMGALLQVLARNEKFASLRPAIPIIMLTGLITAVLSCITGFLLFRSGDYDASLVSWHMWIAIALTFVAFALCARSFFGQSFDRTGILLTIGLFLLIPITGYLGGSLTHGKGYLTSAARHMPPGDHRQKAGSTPENDPALPPEPVDPADSKTIAALSNAGAKVMPLAQGSNYLSVNFSGLPATSLLHLLLSLKEQLIRLDLSNTSIGDSAAATIAQCTRLRYLVLSNTDVTDKSLPALTQLSELRVLDLAGTQVTGEGLLRMQPPKHLHAVYLYHTRVDSKYWNKLQGLFKGAVLDSGKSIY
ncbi:hypothetical protein Q4E93_01630 [Flavitalea sp. BT771]|uniref:DUF2231 domain-containing protein n=1 Tax=Flavitalea sp. BT771 TaxID=3063329 RepID=UPI0026E425D9|nr:DUF2231 domain-containing protein [Flavitalea sp. BT771]MDO6429268.1 hypothetical protein [Flavitalea sp. BT771]MDV6218604.1 DUF2231 domain-containing protein [Flavitalea sp. BT771]